MTDTNSTDALIDAIYAFIPKKLDDLIKQHRDVASLYLSTEQEMMDLYAAVTPGTYLDIIDDWRLISLRLKKTMISETLTFLLGIRRSNGNLRITSDIVKLDLDRGLVITKSGSLYKLGARGEGEPPFEGLVMICSAFHDWGFGPAFGTPKFSVDNESDH